MKRNKNKLGFTPFRTLSEIDGVESDFKVDKGVLNTKQPSKVLTGFTLIELLVVIAIIALLSSIVLIGLMSARQKSRDVKRLSDMTQMNTGLELYFSTNKGYPSASGGLPSPLVPNFASKLPSAPLPADGGCASVTYPAPVPTGVGGSSYYYYPSGTAYLAPDGSTSVYPDYAYYFCLGNQTGNFPAGSHVLTPTGVH